MYSPCRSIMEIRRSFGQFLQVMRSNSCFPPDYHGGPEDPQRSLVISEWGDDFVEFVSEHSGLATEVMTLSDRKLGLDGNPLEVFISRK